jgi:uridine kinase
VVNDRQLVLVDGRSGAGKTQWARRKQEELGFFLLSLDDIYPGWDGLDAGHRHAFHHGILPWSRGEVARIRRWDWESMRPAGVIDIDPSASLIIEGCGSLSVLTSPFATERYWVEADVEVRYQRAVERDGDVFAPHWLRWSLQEDRFYKIHGSRNLADIVMST